VSRAKKQIYLVFSEAIPIYLSVLSSFEAFSIGCGSGKNKKKAFFLHFRSVHPNFAANFTKKRRL